MYLKCTKPLNALFASGFRFLFFLFLDILIKFYNQYTQNYNFRCVKHNF